MSHFENSFLRHRSLRETRHSENGWLRNRSCNTSLRKMGQLKNSWLRNQSFRTIYHFENGWLRQRSLKKFVTSKLILQVIVFKSVEETGFRSAYSRSDPFSKWPISMISMWPILEVTFFWSDLFSKGFIFRSPRFRSLFAKWVPYFEVSVPRKYCLTFFLSTLIFEIFGICLITVAIFY